MKSSRFPMPDVNTTAETVILADGEYPSEGIPAAILRNARYVVCCDGAADAYIGRGGVPDAIVGDGDSVSLHTKELYADRVFLCSEQETNDLTKAFSFCLERGRDHITILGATGRREDHTIGNISLLADYTLKADIQMVTPTGVFNAIHEEAQFDSVPGQQVSIITIGTSTKVRVENLKYTPPPDGLCSWWRGTLNEAESDSFNIVTDGASLIFRAFGIKQRV